jgi:hypothetical protein
MSKPGDKPPPRPAPSAPRPAAVARATAVARAAPQPREVIGRFFATIGRLEGGERSNGEGAR